MCIYELLGLGLNCYRFGSPADPAFFQRHGASDFRASEHRPKMTPKSTKHGTNLAQGAGGGRQRVPENQQNYKTLKECKRKEPK